jgi:hypothetical protein
MRNKFSISAKDKNLFLSNRQKWVLYKLAINKMINGLLSKLSNTIVLPTGQKMGPGAIAPQFMLNHIVRLQAVVKIITDKTARALNC